MPRNREKQPEIQKLEILYDKCNSFLHQMGEDPNFTKNTVNETITRDWWTAVMANMQLHIIASSEICPRLRPSSQQLQYQESILSSFQTLCQNLFFNEDSPEIPNTIEISNGNEILSRFLRPNTVNTRRQSETYRL